MHHKHDTQHFSLRRRGVVVAVAYFHWIWTRVRRANAAALLCSIIQFAFVDMINGKHIFVTTNFHLHSLLISLLFESAQRLNMKKKKIGKISYSNHMKNFFIQFFLSFFSSLCCWLYFHFYWLSYLYVLPLCIVVMIVYTQNYSDSFDLPFYISLCSPFVITACLLYSHALSLMDGRISKIMKIRRGMRKMLDGLGDWAHFDSQICINEEWSSEEIIGGLWMELIYGNVI